MKYFNSLSPVRSLMTPSNARRGFGGLVVALSLFGAVSAFAAINYNGSGPWTASVDITNNTSAHTGLVVNAATYAKCVTEFSAAMASHQASHGDTFGNIKPCSYLPPVVVAGAVELVSVVVLDGAFEELSDAMAELEERYEMDRYLAERAEILEQYKAASFDGEPEASSRR